MKYVLGIDGGGTKTAYLLCNENGDIAAACAGPGCSYKQHGTETALETLTTHVARCVQEAGIHPSDIAGACAGLPCYGEAPVQDAAFAKLLCEKLSAFPLYLVNDAEVGWAGSLAGQPGINIVAGTGSIAFGVDGAGRSARCGGWSWVFGDEGSCHWAGMKTMELFSKEADGRIPRGALYTLLREKLALSDDMDFVEIMENEYCPHRDKTASLQRWLCDAAEVGDEAARTVYREAAAELAMAVTGVAGQLSFEGPVRVSYSGGIFRAGALMLEPFSALLPQPAYILCTPVLSPVAGAALLAFREFLPGQQTAAAEALARVEKA